MARQTALALEATTALTVGLNILEAITLAPVSDDPNLAAEIANMLGMDKVSLEIDTDGDLSTTDDVVGLDLFFADAGNIDSTFLSDKLKFES